MSDITSTLRVMLGDLMLQLAQAQTDREALQKEVEHIRAELAKVSAANE